MRTGLLLLLGLGVSSCSGQAEPASLARGAELLTPFKTSLQQALREGLVQGPVEAIASCRLQAPDLAQGHSHQGIRIGRASHRLRNPANVSPEWVRPILEAYLARPSKRDPRSVRLPDGRFGYAEPIVTQELCLVCHGALLDPGVASKLAESYPEDRAVGFQVGDLRGVFWIEFSGSD